MLTALKHFFGIHDYKKVVLWVYDTGGVEEALRCTKCGKFKQIKSS